MKSIIIKVSAASLFSLLIFLTLYIKATEHTVLLASDHKFKENEIKLFTYEKLSDTILISKLYKNEQEKQIMVINEEYIYYDIPLSDELQDYIWKNADEHDLNYELILAVIYVESTFREDVISYNGSSAGLMQINRNNTLTWLAKETKIKNVDPFNPYHSVKMGTWYLSYLRDYWLDRGVDKTNATKAALISYHRGLGGAKTYIRNNGYNSNYVNKIYQYRKELTMP